MYPVAFLVIATRERERGPLCDVCNLGDLARTKGATWSSKQMLLDDLWMFTGMFWIFNDLWIQPAQGLFWGNFEGYWLQLNLVFFFDISNGMKPGFVPVKNAFNRFQFFITSNLVYSTVSLGSTLMAAFNIWAICRAPPFADKPRYSIFLLTLW